MSESAPHKKIEETKRKIDERAEEEHITNMAYASRRDDPAFRNALAHRLALETEASSIARSEAIESARVHKSQADKDKFSQRPWGIPSLEKNSTPESIYSHVQSSARQTAEDSEKIVKDREAALDQEMTNARELTLKLAHLTAQKLRENDVPPDTTMRLAHTEHVKRFSGEVLRTKGKLRSEIPEIIYEKEANGKPHAWKLPISGQVDNRATVLLNEDGGILISYGEYMAGADDGQPGRLTVQPNKSRSKDINDGMLPLINRPEPAVIPPETYTSRLDHKLESDIGLAILPTNAIVSKANMVLDRERAMQEAILSLLVEHNIPINDEEPQTEVMHT